MSGYGLIEGVRARQVPGYPSSGQINYYIIVPSIVALAVGSAGICIWFGRFKTLAHIALVISFVFLFPYLIASSAGM